MKKQKTNKRFGRGQAAIETLVLLPIVISLMWIVYSAGMHQYGRVVAINGSVGASTHVFRNIQQDKDRFMVSEFLWDAGTTDRWLAAYEYSMGAAQASKSGSVLGSRRWGIANRSWSNVIFDDPFVWSQDEFISNSVMVFGSPLNSCTAPGTPEYICK